MRRVLTAALSSALLVVGTPARSHESAWVLVAETPRTKPTPGTVAWSDGIWGTGYYVDLRSIVRRGNRSYFNHSFAFLGPGGDPCHKKVCLWNFGKGAPENVVTGIANCNTFKLIKNDGSKYGTFGIGVDIPYYSTIARFVCSN